MCVCLKKKKNGCGEIVAVQLRCEFLAGREVPIDGVRAVAGAS